MITFKTDRIRDEFGQLAFKNPKLFDLLTDLKTYVEEHMHRDIVLTCILRTKEENDELYKLVPVEKRPNSPHLGWGAVDLRSSTFSDDEIHQLVAYLNVKYKNASGKPVALFHSIPGNVKHFHIQYR